ncbi:MAG: hypothetical protein ACI8S6_003494 [Myxococcota bacterium]|jgi:hypothetical protein
MLALLLVFSGVLRAQAAPAPGCLDPAVLVERTHEAILDSRLEDAAALMGEVERAMGCWGTPSPELLSRLWLVEGVRLYFADDIAGSQRAFAASARTHPTSWPREYGTELEAFHSDAVEAPRGEGELLLRDAGPDMVGVVDGQAAAFPVVVIEGPHLVQVLTASGEVIDARLVMLPPGEAIEIALDPTAQWAVRPEPVVPPVAKRPGLLIGGSVAALAAGGMVVLARSQGDALSSAEALPALEQAYTRQRVFAGAAYGLAGVSAVGFGLYFAL